MHLIAPDILADGKGLSVAACGVGLGVGAFVWLLGGWSHRFWIVLLTTLAAGVSGLSFGEAFGVQPLVSALLLAAAAGVLALALARLGAFFVGGVAACVLGEHAGWNEPFVQFFVGGFLGLLLFRFWFMVLSSLGGTLVMGHSLLWLLEKLGKLDAEAFAETKPILLNWACGGMALLGLLLQAGVERRRRMRERDQEEEDDRYRGPFLLRWLPFSGGKKRRAA